MTKVQVAGLPAYVQAYIMDILRAYKAVHVTYENGQYSVSTAIGIKSGYADDHRYVGVVYADDVYTRDELLQNYIDSFGDYPIWYDGKRDYAAIRAKFAE